MARNLSLPPRACPLFVPPPADLACWTLGAVAVTLPEATGQTHFPANVGGMLVLRTEGFVFRVGRASPLPKLALIGPSATPMCFQHQGVVCAYGLLLTAPAVSLLSGQFNHYCAGRDLDLQALLPLPSRRLSQTVLAASGDADRCAVLFDWLRQVIADQPDDANRWGQLASFPPLLMQGKAVACAQLGIGTRQLERLCLLRLGMSAHRARAVLRMQATLFDAMAPNTTMAGAELAQSQGYYDQSHMGRDLRRLAGLPLARAVAASRMNLDETLWAFSVGRQQAAGSGYRDSPDTAAMQTTAPHRSTAARTPKTAARASRTAPKR